MLGLLWNFENDLNERVVVYETDEGPYKFDSPMQVEEVESEELLKMSIVGAFFSVPVIL